MQKKLITKLAQVMKEVKYIEKRGYNRFHKYKFVTEADVNEKVREVLSEKNIMLIPNIIKHETIKHINKSGNTEYIVTVDMEFSFIDGETGEDITFHMSGSGQDSGDKAIMKAISAAQKYALMKAFMIPTGDDPEADSSVDERNQNNKNNEEIKVANSKQVGTIKALALQFGKIREVSEKEVLTAVGITDLQKISFSHASKSIKQLENWIDKAQKEMTS